jgi:hypothetical protein
VFIPCLLNIWGVMLFLRLSWVVAQSGISKCHDKRRMASSAMLRRVALVRTDVSEEPGSSFIRAARIDELGTTQAATTQKTPFFSFREV